VLVLWGDGGNLHLRDAGDPDGGVRRLACASRIRARRNATGPSRVIAGSTTPWRAFNPDARDTLLSLGAAVGLVNLAVLSWLCAATGAAYRYRDRVSVRASEAGRGVGRRWRGVFW
jgi:hypothetical protein